MQSKLKHEDFIRLNNELLQYFDKKGVNKRFRKNKRVVAIDRNLINLPHTKVIEDKFGGVSNQNDYW